MASRTETEKKVLDDGPTSAAASESNSSTAVRPAQASPVDPFIGRVLSHYRLEEQLGAGGMGLLYRATDLTLGRAVAIKLLARSLATDETAKARFVQEARAASALDHPNIANIHDIGEVDGELFIVMALYEGETLKQRLKRGRLSADEVVRILRQLALGLEAAHRAGIVHRDIKPANILLTSGGTIKILDFGVAKLLDETQAQLTHEGHTVGTVLYMSPEQLGGRPVDARNDLWSVGVVAQELLSGVSPFQAESSPATIARILHDEPVSLASVPGVPGWLALLVSQLLRKNPAERPQGAGELLLRLETQTGTGGSDLPVVPAHARAARVRWRTALALAIGLFLAAAGGWALRNKITNRSADVDRSIAVLPFASLSKGEENAYLAAGFHDELLRQIGKIGDFRVISRTSVLQYKPGARNLREIAEALGVSSIVEGTVQREGQRVRVAATLIDARGDRQLWANSYDEDAGDLFAIQTAVAEAIAHALKARLSPEQKEQLARKPTQSAEAYELYLRALDYAGRPRYEPSNLEAAQRLYRRSIQIDPSFAVARARLAGLLLITSVFVTGTPDSVAEEGRTQAEESLRLQPDLPDGHFALGLYHYWRNDFERALKELEIARAALPGEALSWIASIEHAQGKFDQAIRTAYRAVELDPRSPNTLFNLTLSLTHVRRYQEADPLLERALTIAPDFLEARAARAIVHELWKGEIEPAEEALRYARQRVPGGGAWSVAVIFLMTRHPREALPILDALQSESLGSVYALYPKAFLYAVAHQALGDPERARKEYQAAIPLLEAEVQKGSPPRPFQRPLLAYAYAGVGRKEDALREARRAGELFPISRDAYHGPSVEIWRAAVEARVGEKDAAIDRIRYLLSIPSYLSPGLLRIDPSWAPLRDDPRFRKLAELDEGSE